jgi:uncharacterized membrane protein
MVKRTASAGDAPPSTAKDPNIAATAIPVVPAGADELIGRTVTINRPRHELYDFWRDFRNLPLFMENIQSVQIIDAQRSHWCVRGPANSVIEWDSVVTEDVPGESLAWTTVEKTGVPNGGRIVFRDTDNARGTQVTVTILYDPPAGALGKAVAKLFRREPNIQARQDLRRFKQLMETGEISTSALTNDEN